MSREKCLYQCECLLDGNEYGKMLDNVPKFYKKRFISKMLLGGIFIIPLAISSFIISGKVAFYFILFVIYLLFIMYPGKKVFKNSVIKGMNKAIKEDRLDYKYKFSFYEDYFKRETKVETIKVNYSDISNLVETDTNFYLNYAKRDKTIIIKKEDCSKDLINFIQKKCIEKLINEKEINI